MKDHSLSTAPRNRLARSELVIKLNQLCRNNGNSNILLVHAIAQHINLSASEFECYSYMYDHGPLTAGELAKACGITTGGMTGMIDRLERARFATRTTDPNDRRRVLVSAVQNKKTFKKIAKLYEPLSKRFNQLVTRYSDDELAIIIDFMDLANDMIREAIDTLPNRKG